MDGRVLATTGAMVSYRSTPVGPYHEVMGQVALLRGRRVLAHVPFIAVDSEDSVAGGRENWFLPKTLATFAGDAASGRLRADGEDWTVDVRARPLGLAVPLSGGFTIVQSRPDGGSETRSPGHGRLRARPALVRVRVSGSIGPLRSGVFPGLVAEHATATLGPPSG